MTTLTINYFNEVYIKVTSDEPHVEQELSELLTYEIPGSKFMARKNPKYKNWNGKIKLYSKQTKKIYYGLLDKIIQYAADNSYDIVNNLPKSEINMNDNSIQEFIDYLKLPVTPRDYQIAAFLDCVNSNRRLIVSPTGSGKSLLIYMLSRYYLKGINDNKVLIIVPTTNLVEQMAGDFLNYGYKENVHKIYSGKEKNTDDTITVSTWQSLQNIDPEWFKQFSVVFFDEAHTCKSRVLSSILCSLVACKYRFGFTGTLQSEEVNILVLEGLFNTHNKVISSKELMDRGELANLSIDIIMLNYDDITKKLAKDFEYQDEINFLISHRKRNSFISGLVQSLKGNTLVLFNRVDGHGKLLFDLLKDKMENVYFLHGKVDVKDRHGTIQKVDNLENSVIIASYGVFQLGINIPNLNNAIFASPSKSKIRNLQSIGRILRISSKKNSAKLYDIADNLVYKGKNNFTLNHLFERVKIYNDEEFKYRTHQYTIG